MHTYGIAYMYTYVMCIHTRMHTYTYIHTCTHMTVFPP